MPELYTQELLIRDIQELGITKGDIIFLRISYKSIGKVEGGPKGFLDALLKVVGKEGTIVATAFPNRFMSVFRLFHQNKIYRKNCPPPCIVGAISSVAMNYSNAQYSGQPVYPFVAIGKHAQEITSRHHVNAKAYDLIVDLAENYNAKCLRIGGRILVGTTHIAFTEALQQTNSYQRKVVSGLYAYDNKNRKKWYRADSSVFCYDGYEKFFKTYLAKETSVILAQGNIGAGKAMITSMQKTLELERKYLKSHPEKLCCDNPNCYLCRSTFSFSQSPTLFFLKQIKNIFSNNRSIALSNIYHHLMIILLGSKCQ